MELYGLKNANGTKWISIPSRSNRMKLYLAEETAGIPTECLKEDLNFVLNKEKVIKSMIMACNECQLISEIIVHAKDKIDALELLKGKLGVNHEQAKEIINMNLTQLTEVERKKLDEKMNKYLKIATFLQGKIYEN